MDNNKKQFYGFLNIYNENLSEIWKKEEEYRNLLVDRYKQSIEHVKVDFKLYSSEYNCTVIEKNNFIEARYENDYSIIRIDFNEILPTQIHFLNLSIVELQKARREYHVLLRPMVENLYIPKRSISVNRPKPNNITEAKTFIKDIGNEYLILVEKTKILEEIPFRFSFYDSRFVAAENEKLTSYNDFNSVLQNLL